MASADRLIEAFDAAKSLPAGLGRDRFIADLLKDDPQLLEQVASLLEAHDGAGGFLQGSFAPPIAGVAERPGDRIGRYKLLEKLGEGGCGVVYMAEQEEPVRRRVALKVIKLGMDTQQVIARFEAERQALALMDHPNIARILDAGATEKGRPYFVMELVRGVKITEYCDQNHLSTGERLKLFTQVCHAIQHAHQKGIIHRDIKPSNILVTIDEPGSPGCPRVIDFGIAKATMGQRLTDKTVFTAFEQFLGTPAYMSPEQAMMTSLDIDTRTDIYALGVLLYELLTGKTPFDAKDLMAAGLDAMRQIIREQEPARPSTRLSTMQAADLTAIARHRQAEPARLGSLLRGDLDWIAMKALEKDRKRRYETASSLAQDVERHLRNEPVEACPPSFTYRFGKLARRHRAGLAIALALAIAMILAVTGLAVSNRIIVREKGEKEVALTRALEEKHRADENLARARKAVKEYLLKTSENPLLRRADFQGLRKELLETAVPFYEDFVRQSSEDPELEAERGHAHDDLGFLRNGLGDFEKSVADFEQAEAIFRRLTGAYPDQPEQRRWLVEACNSHGAALRDLGRIDASEARFRDGLSHADQLLAEHPAEPDYLDAMARIRNNLGLLLKDTGRMPEAESMLRQGVAAREKLVELESKDMPRRRRLAQSLISLGQLLSSQEKLEEAEQTYDRVLELLDPRTVEQIEGEDRDVGRSQHLRCQALNNRGTVRRARGLLAEAEKDYRDSLDAKERLVERYPSLPQHRNELASTYNNLGAVLEESNRRDEAQLAYEKSVTIRERLVADYPAMGTYALDLAGSYKNLAQLMSDRGQLEPSLPWHLKSIDMLEAEYRKNPQVTRIRETLSVSHWSRAITLAGLGRHADALVDWDRAVELDGGRYQKQLRIARASNLLNLKETARAAEDAVAIAESRDVTREELYNCACVYALCASMVPEDPPLLESYAAGAVKLLRQSMEKGFQDADHVKSDADLNSLRERQDFQVLLKDIEAAASERKR